MANFNFNKLYKIDNLSLGNYIPNDRFTEALWIFDGSEQNGAVKDQSFNENHLIPNQQIKYDYAQFGKVLQVTDGLSFTSTNNLNLSEFQPRCFEILFNNNVENVYTGSNPYTTASGLLSGTAGYMATFIIESKLSESDTYGYICIGRGGTIQRISINNTTIIRDLLVETYNNENRYHVQSSPVTGQPYYQALYPKNWIGLAINFAYFMEDDNKIWVNGNKQPIRDGDSLRGNVIGGFSKFKLFPFPDYNFIKNVAFIRVSSKFRTSFEINQMLNYFSSADGYFKNLKIYNVPQGTYNVKKTMSDSLKTFETTFDHSLPLDVIYTRSGLAFSQRNIIEKVIPVYSGLQIFDYDNFGNSLGLRIEDSKQNLFVFNSGNLNADYSGNTWPSMSGNLELNHDLCTKPIYDDYYGESSNNDYQYWIYNQPFINSGIYTISCWVKKTERNNSNGFKLKICKDEIASNFNFQSPFVQVISSNSLLDSTTSDSSSITFNFNEGDDYNKWSRLWATFKIYTNKSNPEILKFAYDNRSYGNRWAVDCHQFEECGLSSWFPNYINSGIKSSSSFYLDTTNKIRTDRGTILFDYLTYNTNSGLTEVINIINLGTNYKIFQKGLYIWAQTGASQRTLDYPHVSIPVQPIRIAMTWDTSAGGNLYVIDKNTGESKSLFTTSEISGNFLTVNSGTTMSGVSFYIKNLRLYQNTLTLDELEAYD